MATIAIPIEIKARELDGKIWLAAALARAGHKVALGHNGHMRNILFEEIKPDIYITKDMSKGGGFDELFPKIQNSGGSVVVLNAEGGMARSIEDWFEIQVWEELLEHVDGIFAWGEMHDEVIRQNTMFPHERIYVTGNPRFDLLHPELNGFYADQAADIQRKFGDYVLFNSNFANVNPFDEELLKKTLAERDIEIDERKLNYNSALFEEFLLMIHELNDHIEQDIIVRPHPGENFDTHRSEFEDTAGVHVEHDGDVRPWILGSEAVLHNNCTTGIESALLNTLPIVFKPELGVQPPDEFSLPNYVSSSAETVEDIVRYIERSNNSEYRMSDEQKSKLQQKMANVTELAAPKMVEAIEELVKDRTELSYPSLSFEQKVKSVIKKYPVALHIQKLRGREKRDTGKKKQKIPELTIEEVKSKLDRLSVATDQIEIDRVTWFDSVFWIDGSSKTN